MDEAKKTIFKYQMPPLLLMFLVKEESSSFNKISIEVGIYSIKLLTLLSTVGKLIYSINWQFFSVEL